MNGSVPLTVPPLTVVAAIAFSVRAVPLSAASSDAAVKPSGLTDIVDPIVVVAATGQASVPGDGGAVHAGPLKEVVSPDATAEAATSSATRGTRATIERRAQCACMLCSLRYHSHNAARRPTEPCVESIGRRAAHPYSFASVRARDRAPTSSSDRHTSG